jgi:hypothetical protein
MLLDAGNLNVQDLLGGLPTGYKISKIGVGTSNTPVTSGDTTLTGALIKPVTGVNHLGSGVIQFTATVDSGDPAMTVREVGLYDDNDVLVHRKVIADTAKVAGVAYVVNYNIKVQ